MERDEDNSLLTSDSL